MAALTPTSASTPSTSSNSSTDDVSPSKQVCSLSSTVMMIENIKVRAEEYRNLGNELFKNSHYEAASQAYSKAIEECETLENPAAVGLLHIYLCNRAFCHLKLENFGELLAQHLVKNWIDVARSREDFLKLSALWFTKF